ncbi:unnamed protein product, partial [Adineta steineri]
NDKPLIPDSRVTTTVENNKYTIVVKDLRPEEDEGVYTLKSDHLVLDTPSISIVPEEKKPQNETVTIEEEETITVAPQIEKREIETYKTETEMPVQEVDETSTITLTIEKSQNTTTKDVVLLKNGEELKPSDHVKITSISPTTTEVQIVKVKPEDEGDYTVEVKGVEQPLVRLIVHPKPVVRQEMQLPKTQFNEKETLTIVCQFDATPEEPFILLHNDKPIVADSRVTTTVENNKYTIVVNDLRPEEDEGVYTLKSDHLILDTPSISIVPEEKKSQTETVTIEEIVTVVPQEEQPRTVTQQEEEVTEITEKKQPQEQIETPIQEVEETTTVTMTVELPQGTTHKDIILLRDNERVKPSDHIQITQTSTTTTEIQINKAKPEDQGVYTVIIDNKQQPLVQLKVIPKPVTRQTMDIPQTTFNEGETLTIKCQFDSAPEETFQFFRNEISLIPNDRISTTVKNNTYIIEVKNLKPK